MAEENRRWLLRARPVGAVKESDFELDLGERPELQEGQALVRVFLLAFDPAMRGWMEDRESYLPPVGLGEVMRGSAVGVVVESRTPDFAEGDVVTGIFGWQEYAVIDTVNPGLLGFANRLPAEATPEQALSVYGITGLTAYFGYLDVGRPEEGDVALVSGAAGATGSVVAQIARIMGASKVVGIAGGPEKCGWLRDTIGVDAAIDYKSEDVQARIREECPQGVNIYFDNVGGDILDAALVNMAQRGRIVLCGGIANYNLESPPPGPRHYMELVARRCRMEGFIVIDYMKRMFEAMDELAKWVAEGRIVVQTDVQEGFENAPRTFLRLFEGKNLGKQLLRIGDAP